MVGRAITIEREIKQISKEVKSDNFTRSIRKKSIIAIALLEK